MTIDISKNKIKKNSKQTSRGRILKSQALVPGVQIEERERKIDEEKKRGVT